MNIRDAWFQKARQTLGVEIDTPYEFTLPDGTRMDAIARLRNFGGKKGMLFLSESTWDDGTADRVPVDEYGCILVSDGFFAEEFDAEQVEDMLADWKWRGNDADAPAWMAEATARISDKEQR